MLLVNEMRAIQLYSDCCENNLIAQAGPAMRMVNAREGRVIKVGKRVWNDAWIAGS